MATQKRAVFMMKIRLRTIILSGMDADEIKKGWIQWGLLEAALTGGYYAAETNLPPLLDGLLPSEYRGLGWAALHALLQLIVWVKWFRPLVQARVEALFPQIDERSTKLMFLFSFFPATQIFLLVWLSVSKGADTVEKTPLFVERPLPTFVGIGAFVYGSLLLNFTSDPPFVDLSSVRKVSYWTLDPVSHYIAGLADGVQKTAEVKKTMTGAPERFENPETRVNLYSGAGFENATQTTLFLAVEALMAEKMKKALKEKLGREAGQTSIEYGDLLPVRLGFLEGIAGVIEKSRDRSGRLHQFNPISLMGLGALEAVLLSSIDSSMDLKINHTIFMTANKELKGLAEYAESHPLPPELHKRSAALRNRLLTLFPGATFSEIPASPAASPAPTPSPAASPGPSATPSPGGSP